MADHPEITPAKLLRIIRELDLGATGDIYEQSEISYLEVRRWLKTNNELDHEATAILRRLARDRLGMFSVEEIGTATLSELDGGSR